MGYLISKAFKKVDNEHRAQGRASVDNIFITSTLLNGNHAPALRCDLNYIYLMDLKYLPAIVFKFLAPDTFSCVVNFTRLCRREQSMREALTTYHSQSVLFISSPHTLRFYFTLCRHFCTMTRSIIYLLVFNSYLHQNVHTRTHAIQNTIHLRSISVFTENPLSHTHTHTHKHTTYSDSSSGGNPSR